MSNEVEAIGVIAAPVLLAGGAAVLGAGWLAWQGGKLLVEANRAADRQIAEKKRQAEEEARNRKMRAIAAHNQLVDMCSQISSQLDSQFASRTVVSLEEIEQLKAVLEKICEHSLPDDVGKLESITSIGFHKLEAVIRRQNRLASFELSESEAGLYRGLSVAQLMDDLCIAISAMEIKATIGADVRAVDPAVLERAKLNDAFVEVTNRIMTALESVVELTENYGLNQSGNAWFQSCFNGVDSLIESLYRPTTSNQELKKGIKRLEDSMEKYDMMADSIEKEIMKMIALYKVYADAARALGEKIEDISVLKTSSDIEAKLKYIEKRAKKAQECAAIYQKLGPSAYLCYAWDRELQAMGYKVHSRQQITDMANHKPQHAKLGESKMPFYQWDENDLTQLYSVTEDCDLQVVVHEDGTVSMQTISEDGSDETIAAQKSHCSRMKELHEKLRENWFILYDYKETEPAEKVTTVASWRASDEYAWKGSDIITDRRVKGKGSAAKQMQSK